MSRTLATKGAVVTMKFWLDIRLATEAGETVRRKRVAGIIANDSFEEFARRLVHCLQQYSPQFDCEEDRSQLGAGPMSQAAK